MAETSIHKKAATETDVEVEEGKDVVESDVAPIVAVVEDGVRSKGSGSLALGVFPEKLLTLMERLPRI